VRTALHIQARVIHDELYSVVSDLAPLCKTFERWSHRFCEGREEVEDKGGLRICKGANWSKS
jgi:hypothetical protein